LTTAPPAGLSPFEAAGLLRDLWREVSRHLEIVESAERLWGILRAALPVHGLRIYRFDADRAELRVAADAGTALQGAPQRLGLPSPRAADLRLWASQPALLSWRDRAETSRVRLLVPEQVHGPGAAAPLVDGGALLGVLVLLGPLGDVGDLLTAVAEPFTAALHNDARLHELTRLREAAEADRRALLDKLGRQEMGDAVVGEDGGLREVMLRVGQVAPTDAPVLLLGETGAGKEVVARAIHTRSRRARGPFLRVNCGAIPPELVDSELFGHERGAFTGATTLRRGWFERADGGTLLLDEVAELPPAAQVRLLRVLQDGTFERVGGQSTLTADVRIVTATHRDLAAMVREGSFREDLWYRVSVFPVVLPALRARRGDIGPLARHFAARAGLRLFGRPLVPTPEDEASLAAYDWPGNVRELAAVIERAAILGGGKRLEVTTALGVLPSPPKAGAASATAEADAIAAALERALGRIEGPFGAARALGVNPHTLRSRMRRLGIDWSRYRVV
jgi:transcriptional regulator with GAF, ATPase, and Fis domain